MPETSVTFEYCMEGIDDFKKEPQKAVVNALRARDKLQSAYPDIGINMWPYARVKSVLSGGRKAVFDKKQLMEISQRFNRSGTPFILAWNGGIGMQKNLEIDWDSPHFRHVYKLLAHLQGGHPDNAVTLMRDDVLDQVCEAFPYLKKIASCMKFMGGKRGEFSIEPGDDEYDRAMRDDRLDYIVPANQHSTPEFLHRFRDRIEKLILFLDLKCSRSNMHECLLHMAEFEKLHHSRRDAWYFDLDDIVPKEDFVSIPS
ncbi:MAG: hypothetical protein HOG49_16480, partial [Candidatus Scalindua sp.]|nr:hypothetical protein [Candidatus Scalindua sp.]